MRHGYLFGALLSVLMLSGLSCPGLTDGTTDTKRVAALRGFGSAEELRSYLAEQAVARYGSSRGGIFPLLNFGTTTTGAVADTSAPTANESAGDGASTSFSTTNIQEAGVDESDIVKNDGQYIYVLQGSTIHIVQAAPTSAMAELATIKLENSGDSIYLRGTKLIALSRLYDYYWYGLGYATVGAEGDAVATSSGSADAPVIAPSFRDGTQTTVTVIDVSDPAVPVVDATIRLEGQLASSRLIDNLLYLVLTTTPRLPDNPIPLAINAMSLEEWIPDFQTVDAEGNVVSSGDIAGWEDFYRPEDPDGYGISTVITLDVDAPTSAFKKTAISADAGTIYASTKALYIADTNYSYTNYTSRTDTAIHKVAFVPEGTTYKGSGLVPGRLLNQYSLGEFENDLRVATTVEDFSSNGVSRQDNNVYVLREAADASLATIGQIEGIAPGEQIYAARFIGKRGFLVTYHRVDPLYTLDLSDPVNPKIAGQLKVPGYSDHIQLLDENHLLTIGKDTQDTGFFAWIRGVQLSVFDVTIPAAPTLLYKETIGGRGTSSEANTNPKAFNYFAAKDVLALPLDVYADTGEGGASWGDHEFTGLYVYHVTAQDGFQFLGRIASDEGLDQNGCFLGYYGFTRGVFIDDAVYSVTERNVKAASLDAVGTIVGQANLSSPLDVVKDCYLYAPTIAFPGGSGLE